MSAFSMSPGVRGTATTAAEGALSGLVATIPMTVAMEVLRRRLPRRQRHALPPRKITVRAFRKIGMHSHTDRRQRDVAALIGHLGYGAAAGSVYPLLARRIDAAPPLVADSASA